LKIFGVYMITLSQLYSIVVLLTPVITCFAIVLILGIDCWHSSQNEWQVKSKALLYFTCALVNWSSLLFYFFYPSIFVYINWFVFLTFMLVQVYCYGFLFKITRIDSNEHFSKYHYLLPLFFSLILLGVSLITPFEGQLQIIKARGVCTNEAYRLFFLVSNSKILIRCGFGAVYVVLAFYRLHRYRKFIVNYSGNEEKTRLGWLIVYLYLALGLTPLPILALLYGDRSFVISSSIMGGYNFVFIFQSVYLCYFILKNKYLVLPDEEPVAIAVDEDSNALKKNLLDRESFEQYMLEKKPYLNSDLKITDLIEDLGVNRTYISTFINTEYQMNFCSYINRCRLDEYIQLKKDVAYKGRSLKELAELAGFGSYKSLLRIQDKEV